MHMMSDGFSCGWMWLCAGLKMSAPLAPHVYVIADAAYRAMMEVRAL